MRLLLLATATALCGCAHDVVVVDSPQPRSAQLDIPKGHMPPPGKCRIWHPDRPPGQQPPPGECAELQYRVPPGAVLVGR